MYSFYNLSHSSLKSFKLYIYFTNKNYLKMRKKIQKISALLAITLMGFQSVNAQTNIELSASGTWIGYMNVYFLDDPSTEENEAAMLAFGELWGVPDVKTVVSVPNNTLTLFPNYNLFATGDPFFVVDGQPQKTSEGSSFKEYTSTTVENVTFSGFVQSKTLSSNYIATAFIKGLDPNAGYATVVNVTAELVAGQNFTLTAENVPAGLVVQTGFSVVGLLGNPAQEAENGNVVVTAPNLSVASFEASNIKLYPNPATDILVLNAQENIENVQIFNALGQNVWNQTAYSTDVNIPVSNLSSGLYIIKATINGQESATKFFKK